MDLRETEPMLWEVAGERADMRVPARVFADAELLDAIGGDDSLVQLQNVATLPGVVETWTEQIGRAFAICIRPRASSPGAAFRTTAAGRAKVPSGFGYNEFTGAIGLNVPRRC